MNKVIYYWCSDKSRYDEIFSSLEQHNGKITGDENNEVNIFLFLIQHLGRVAKEEMLKSKLSSHVLGKVKIRLLFI